MKNTTLFLIGITLFTLSLSSCQLVEGIFKAGVWAGVLLVVAIVGLVIFIFAKLFGGGSK